MNEGPNKKWNFPLDGDSGPPYKAYGEWSNYKYAYIHIPYAVSYKV